MMSSCHRTALVAMTVLILTTDGAPLNQSVFTNYSRSSYSLLSDYSGPDFFNHFTTFTGPDPTQGKVIYVDMETARSEGLIRFNGANAIVGVEHKKIAPSGRESVRLTSKQTFSPNTLSVLDVRHVPVQWGLWPAIWFLGNEIGGTWPATNGGEADWLEWIHDTPYNSMTLHTGPDCSVQNASSSSFQGTLLNTNCNLNSGYEGCSITAPNSSSSPPTAGHAFNSAGGAVYVHLWTPTGVTIWMFPHDNLPADLAAGSDAYPDPDSWTDTPPLAHFGGSGCDFTTALSEMQLIINIDFCGTWAGKQEIWESSGAREGTGIGTCEEFVSAHPEEFAEAYFEIAGLRFYEKRGEEKGNVPMRRN